MLNNNIKQIITDRNISVLGLQKKLANNNSTITYANIHRVVNAESLDNCKLKTLSDIATVLDVPVDDLFDEKN